MSICDEGWDTHNGNCICWDYEQDYCNLEQEPDNCFYIPILKLLAGAKEVKGPNDKSAMRYKTIHGDTMEEWESYTFWTRR